MNVEKLKITPSLAKEMLLKNKNNRRVKPNRVTQFAKEISNGLWVNDTGETIKVAENGNLLDGQHRLMAIIKANIPVEILVASGLKDNVFSVIDTGAKRGSSDSLSIMGVKNPTQTSAIISRFLMIKTGSRSHVMQDSSFITNQMVVKEYNKNPKLWEGIIYNAITWYKKINKVLSATVIGAWYATFRLIDEEDSFQFFEELCKGEQVTNITIKILRDHFINEKLEHVRMHENKRSSLIIKTWNCYRKKTVIKQLRYNDTIDRDIKPI
jgi:hypothetical protein